MRNVRKSIDSICFKYIIQVRNVLESVSQKPLSVGIK